MKKITILGMLLLMSLPMTLTAGSTQASLNGSSGIIYVPSAETIPSGNILLGSWVFLEDPASYAPRFLMSFIPNWELGLGADFCEYAENSLILNTKYQFYDAGVKIALGFNYQNNGGNKDSNVHNDNYQLFLAFTWAGYGKTSSFIGYTWGDDTNKDEIDFGIGFEKELFGGSGGALSLIFDFSNDNYRRMVGPMTGVGEDDRGIFNIGARISAFDNKVNFDFISVDMLDEAREWALSFAFRLGF